MVRTFVFDSFLARQHVSTFQEVLIWMMNSSIDSVFVVRVFEILLTCNLVVLILNKFENFSNSILANSCIQHFGS